MAEPSPQKVRLAFFLVVVAATMVFTWMFFVFKIEAPGATDPGTVALLASFVTMFIKMAADAVGYQYGSSAGSDKKDERNSEVASKLAEKVGNLQQPTLVYPWWALLTDEEKAKITEGGKIDARIQTFIMTSAAGKATPEDIDYLVSAGLLSAERAAALKAM